MKFRPTQIELVSHLSEHLAGQWPELREGHLEIIGDNVVFIWQDSEHSVNLFLHISLAHGGEVGLAATGGELMRLRLKRFVTQALTSQSMVLRFNGNLLDLGLQTKLTIVVAVALAPELKHCVSDLLGQPLRRRKIADHMVVGILLLGKYE